MGHVGLGETDAYTERQRIRANSAGVGKTFVAEGKVALKRHWLLLVYMVLLMAGFNFMSHGSQDLYPTLLENQYEVRILAYNPYLRRYDTHDYTPKTSMGYMLTPSQFSSDAVTVTQVVANLGAMCGGTTVGYLSQKLGRRFSIIYISIVGGLLLYPYSFVSTEKVAAAAFFEQFCVQGAWGVIPIHLMELSPSGYRTFVVGTSYQLGNLVSSASSTIEATIGERFPLPPLIEDGEEIPRYAYGKVICIFMACVYVYVIVLTILGPEFKGRKMTAEDDSDLAEAAGRDAVERVVHKDDISNRHSGSDEEKALKD